MNVWDLIIMQPMINVLIVLSSYLFSNFGLTVIAFTIVIRLLMYPLSIKQLRATKAVQTLQPKLAELQKKYAKDRAKLAQEQMRLYRESGVSPAGCLVPMLVQMPIWIALYWAILKVLAATPEELHGLASYLYPWPIVYSMVPLDNKFMWLNLATSNFPLALLVGVTMWVQQKMVMPTAADPAQRTQSNMMLWMMPLMFFFVSLQFPSGLALYWVVSNIISIVMQYFVTGWGGLLPAMFTRPVGPDKKYRAKVSEAPVISAEATKPSSGEEAESEDGKSGDKRQDRRTSYPKSPRAVRRQPGRDRGHHPK